VYKIVSDKYDPIPKMYSSALNVLIQRMLEKDADKRPSVRELLTDDYVHKFMNEYVQTRGRKVATPAKRGGGAARAGGAPGTAAAAASAETAPPGSAGSGAPGGGVRPPRPAPQRQDPARRTGGIAAPASGAPRAAGAGGTRKMETPNEARLRRKREAADRQAAELKAAAKKAEANKMVARQMQEQQFKSTRLGSNMAPMREAPTTPGGSYPAEVAREESEEEVYTEDSEDSEGDYEEYTDDFEEEDYDSEDREGDSGGEGQVLGPTYGAALAVREEEDFGRVMANYNQHLSDPHEAAHDATSSPPPRRAPSAASAVDVPVGAGAAGATMNMHSRMQKWRDELVEKMGVETFEKTFGYMLNARQQNMDDKQVRRELEALVGRDTYKKYCFDVDQLVFHYMCYS